LTSKAGCRFVGERITRVVLGFATLVVIVAIVLRVFPAVLLVAPAEDLPVLAYERRARNRELTFRLEPIGGEPVLRDAETNSTWDIAMGKATSGPMAGAQLNRATAYPAFWFGWRGYFPATGVWERPTRSR